MASHSLDFWLTSEDLPAPENRVTLNRNGDIVLTYTPNNLQGHERLKAKLQSLRKQHCNAHGHECHQGLFARNLFIGQQLPLAAVAHKTAPFASATIRKPQLSTATARRTRLTTCTWSTRALPVQRRREPCADDHGKCN